VAQAQAQADFMLPQLPTNAMFRYALGNIIASQIYLVRANSNFLGPASYRIRCKCSDLLSGALFHYAGGWGRGGAKCESPGKQPYPNLPEMGYLVPKSHAGAALLPCGPLRMCSEWGEVRAGG
jgi:hypothetical protein